MPDSSGALCDLQPLRTRLRLNDRESETKFDHLYSLRQLNLQSNFLTRVPSVKNMRSLQALYLGANRIASIQPGDFLGATRVALLTLGNNAIVSVAVEAFAHLTVFRVKPDEFDPKNDDGTPVLDACKWLTDYRARGTARLFATTASRQALPCDSKGERTPRIWFDFVC